jgi:hypothetical protein
MSTFPAFDVAMCTYFHSAEEMPGTFQRHCGHYKADLSDIEILDIRPGRTWERGVKSHYTLRVKTYRGWKVYQYMTGCLASMPAREPNPGDTVNVDTETGRTQGTLIRVQEGMSVVRFPDGTEGEFYPSQTFKV